MRPASSVTLIILSLFMTAFVPLQAQGASGALGSAETMTPVVMNVSWTNVTPASNPPGLLMGAFAYDPPSDRFVQFGGMGTMSFSSTTWAYDLDNNTWDDLAPMNAPYGTLGPGCAYDSNAQRMVVFGTLSSMMAIVAETWIFNSTDNTWIDQTSGIAPSARSFPGMAFDSQSDVTILWGGAEDMFSAPICRNDTWAYDLGANTWTATNATFLPLPRFAPGMAYDSESDRVIMFGGCYDNPSQTVEVFYQDTWAYDFDSNTWTNMSPSGPPAKRAAHSMFYDPVSDRVLVYGGFTGTAALGDLWAYDFNSNTWAQVPQTTSPGVRYFASVAIDPATSDVVMFSGTGDGGDILTDTWVATMGADVPEFPSVVLVVTGTVVLVSLIGYMRRSRPPQE